jgi:hypothetical protein
MQAWSYIPHPLLGVIPNIRWLEEQAEIDSLMEKARKTAEWEMKRRELERMLREMMEERKIRVRMRIVEVVVVGKEGEKEDKRKSMEKKVRELIEGWVELCKQEGRFTSLEHHEPHVHAVFEPVFDLGTTARFTLRAVNRGHWKLVATIDAELIATPIPAQAPTP